MIRCIIVDDEPIAIRALRAHMDPLEDVEIVATCSNAFEARRLLRTMDVDLVLLDIEMPQLTGVGLVQSLERPPRFIFTTAYREYAHQGFDLDAVDYLLKPISLPRLLRALEKYRRLAADPAGRADAETRMVHVRVNRRTVKLDVSEIRFVESVGDYVKLHTTAGELMTKQRITDLEASLSVDGFVRIHRSFLVSLNHVHAFTSSSVEIARRVLPISRTYRDAALRRLQTQE